MLRRHRRRGLRSCGHGPLESLPAIAVAKRRGRVQADLVVPHECCRVFGQYVKPTKATMAIAVRKCPKPGCSPSDLSWVARVSEVANQIMKATLRRINAWQREIGNILMSEALLMERSQACGCVSGMPVAEPVDFSVHYPTGPGVGSAWPARPRIPSCRPRKINLAFSFLFRANRR